MDERLRPLNGLLGLVIGDGLFPAPFKDAGFAVAGLEVPTRTPLGNVVIDVLLHQAATNELLACEVKSGANLEEDQARRYGAIDAAALVETAAITLPQRIRPSVRALYVCLKEHSSRIQQGLTAAGVAHDVLVIGPQEALYYPASSTRPGIVARTPLPVPPPPIVPFDHDSAPEEMAPAVHAELVAALAHRRPQVTVPWLAEQAAPYFSLYGRQERRRLIRKVGQAARSIADEDPATFVFVPSGGNDDAVVRLLRTPETNDPRGRTQAYQALSRVGPRRGRRTKQEDPDQLDLLQHIEQDEDERSVPEPGEEADI